MVEAHRRRPEIQGLRAIAVLAVLLFHIWPDGFPGGYVGVDVFFVISGFLITGLLVRELESGGRVDFGAFYLRRLRRLMPMAVLVLAVIALLAPLLLPAAAWWDVALDVAAGALYVENWRLAAQAVDYLAAEAAPSPVQHYWSLSVEEQFYLVWPALLAAIAWFGRRVGVPLRRSVPVALALVLAGSFATSVVLTPAEPAQAYFATHVRVWQLTAGALLALVRIRAREWVHDLAGIAGIACIVAAVVLFDSRTEFPGYAAALPVLGAVLAIFAGNAGPVFKGGRLLASRPMCWIGDASYSIYLWHWPLLVFYLGWRGGEGIGLAEGVVLAVVTIGLSGLTRVHVEDRFRHAVPGPGGRGRVYWRAAGTALFPVLLAAVLMGLVLHQQYRSQQGMGQHPGARVLADGAPQVPPDAVGDDYLPTLAMLRKDHAPAYDNGCHAWRAGTVPVGCHYGDPEGRFKVFLVGDSHALNWAPALEQVARERGWNAVSYTKSSCALLPVMLRREGKPYRECLEWGRQVRRIIADERPDLVIQAQMYGARTWSPGGQRNRATTDAILAFWRELMDDGIRVVAIADTPRWTGISPEKCLARDPGCQVGLAEVSVAKKDMLVAAQREEPRVALLDFTDVVCPHGSCPVVIGNVAVWRDAHHLTATYARSLAGFFGQRLDEALARDRPARAEGRRRR